MKTTKTQREALKTVWTQPVAYGTVSQSVRSRKTSMDKDGAASLGFTTLHRTTMANLVTKGLARVLVTKIECESTRYGKGYVTMLILTDKGREIIGV